MSNRLGDERGAIAILTAILSFLLFGMSALAVDLGNMYARSGDAQKAADLAALAGAAVLVPEDDRRDQPGTSDIARARDEAHRVLVANAVYSDGSGFGLPGASDPVWINGDDSDGEIGIDVSTMQVTVVVPPRTVHFGLAAVFGIGESTVSARAVAEVRAPGQLLPFYLPDMAGCRTQSQFMAELPGGPIGDPSFNPPNGPGGPVLAPGTLTMTNGTVTIFGEPFQDVGMRVEFILGNRSVFASGSDIISVQLNPSGEDSLVVTVPSRVRATPGTWAIRVRTLDWGGPDTSPYLVLVIPSPTTIDDCDDPNPVGHLALFTPDPGQTALITQYIENGIRDGVRVGDTVTIDPAFLTVGATSDGLIDPPGGRLFASAPTSPGCVGAGDRTIHGILINNDVLSCFIDNQPPNHSSHSVEGTLPDDCDNFPADLNNHPGRSLRPTIYNSPRFFFIPVLEAPLDPSGSLDVQVREFRAVFLTDETQGGGVTGPASNATNDNGLSIQGSSVIEGLTVYAFCPDELPNVVKEGGSGFPWQPGLPTAIRLVD